MSFIIKNLYYKVYMNEYYEKNRELIIDRNLNYYHTNKKKIRPKQNFYYKNIYYPTKRFHLKHRTVRPKKVNVIIEKNVTVIL
jgi:hypothetical protein